MKDQIDYNKLTPMMKQYVDIKSENNDAILMFRLGDFYEMFFEDAKVASKVLDIVLTQRGKGPDAIPMCGVPYHAAQSYINRLIGAGYKVAICEQLEDPDKTKGLVERGVIRVITPGTNLNLGDENTSNNFLASAYIHGDSYGLAYLDYSTGHLNLVYEKDSLDKINSSLINQLSILNISELIINKDVEEIIEVAKENNILVNYKNTIEDKEGFDLFLQEIRYDGISLEEIKSNRHMVNALNYLYSYIEETQFGAIDHIRQVNFLKSSEYMALDWHSLYSLDVFSPNSGKNEKTLYKLLDESRTAMGSRTLKQMLEHPLKNKDKINKRLDLVEGFISDLGLLNDLRGSLYGIYDIERLLVRISGNASSPKDLIQLKNSLSQVPKIIEGCHNLSLSSIEGMDLNISSQIGQVYQILEAGLLDNPKSSYREGGVIKEGFSKELDELKTTSIDSASWLAAYETKLKEETGIANLKIKYNKILGYFIEVTKSNLGKIPDYFIRKQTLVNSERFFTEELKSTEVQIVNSSDYINSLEEDLYLQIRDEILQNYDHILHIANLMAYIDVFSNFAHISYKYGYTRPELSSKKIIEITKGRHPIVEQNEDIFIDNDTYIGEDKNFILLTGPNMAGKSTYMRQVALIVIMAQIGCFVPASRAKLGVFDRVFTRIGAHDRLFAGESTFMVEMKEMANIIDKASPDSLIILDEVGRGTSTYDGLSLARALVEYIIEYIGGITIFASHFHELIGLEDDYPSIRNQTMAVEEKDGKIEFLRKVVDGSSDRSYGIHVAKLAGIKAPIINRAQAYLNYYENRTSSNNKDQLDIYSLIKENKAHYKDQNFLKLEKSYKAISDKIESMDINNMSPIEALIELQSLKEYLRKNDQD